MLGLRLRPSPTIDWYMRFSPGFTALSLFAPLVAFTLAFVFLGSQAEFIVWRVVLTGIAVGGTIALMHVRTTVAHPVPNLFPAGERVRETARLEPERGAGQSGADDLPSPASCLPSSTRPRSRSLRSTRPTLRTRSCSPSLKPASLRPRLCLSSSGTVRTGRTRSSSEGSRPSSSLRPSSGCITSVSPERHGRSGPTRRLRSTCSTAAGLSRSG